jgi:septal ring factor EnvC (AmiA/AmiB activator)
MARPRKETFVETSLKECLEQINFKLDNHLKHTEESLEKTNEEIKATNDRIEKVEKCQAEMLANLSWIKWISISLFIGVLGLIGKAVFMGG